MVRPGLLNLSQVTEVRMRKLLKPRSVRNIDADQGVVLIQNNQERLGGVKLVAQNIGHGHVYDVSSILDWWLIDACCCKENPIHMGSSKP